jgi:hypothetical protein
VARVHEDDRAPARDELDVERVAPAAAHERRVGEVLVVRHVVRLVLETECGRVELAPHRHARKARNGLVPTGERVVVVEAEAVAQGRAVGRRADDRDAGLAQALELPPRVLVDVDVLRALERDEVVVKADLVPERLELTEALGQVGPRPVRRRMQDEVRRAEATVVLPASELQGALEA